MIQSLNDLQIKQASIADVDILMQLSIETFNDTFAAYNTQEDMQMYITQNFSRDVLFAELNNSSENFFIIATYNNTPAGYMKLRLPLEHYAALKYKKCIELERIYVLKNFQGTGLGYSLMQHAIEFGKANGFDTLWLGVWNRNEKAIKFYHRYGFEVFGEHEFILGKDVQTDHLMKIDLT